jgi:hypothetical protein
LVPGGGVFGQVGFNYGTSAAPLMGTTPCARVFRSNAPSSATEWLLTTRLDYNIGGNDRLFGRFKTDHGTQPTFTDPISPVFNQVSNQPQYEGQLNETHTFTPNLINQFILTGSWYSAFFVGSHPSAALAAFPYELDDGTFFGFDGSLFTSLGGQDYNVPQGRNVTQYGIVDDVAWTHGNHAFKWGVNYRRNDITQGIFGHRQISRMGVFSLTDFSQGIIDRVDRQFNTASKQPEAIYSLGAYMQDEWRASSDLKFTLALRVDQNSNTVCQRNCFNRLTSPFSLIGHDINTPYNQIVQTGLHQAFPSLEKAVVEPRFGFAWSPLSSKSTVIRGGIGLFTDLYPTLIVDNFALNAPGYTSFTLVGTGLSLAPGVTGASPSADATIAQCNAAFQSNFKAGGNRASFLAAAPAGCAVPNLNSISNSVRNPKYAEWNLEIEQAIGPKTSISLNYVGNHGYDLFNTNAGLNAYCRTTPGGACATPGTSFANLPVGAANALDRRYANVTDYSNDGYSNYNGLTMSVARKIAYGFSGNLNYTWSHSLDTVSNGGLLPYSINDSIRLQPNPFNQRFSYSNSDYDVRHYLSANYVWDLPYKSSNTLWNYVIGGWSVSGTFFARTGTPFSAQNGSRTALLGNASNSILLPDYLRRGVPTCASPDVACLTTAMFTTSTSQTGFGTARRNFFRGPGYFDTDLSVNKNFRITERVNFGMGVNLYNALNHPNFANPTGDITSGQFGLITSTVAPATNPYGSFLTSAVSGRIVQLSGKFTF